MEFEHLSIQELRQTLRERGANSRGSKKQLMARVAEQYGLTPADRAAAVAPAKVRVSVQKSRSACCALLVDPSLPAAHNLQLILRKASTKFRFKPAHLTVIGVAPSAGAGVELHAGNLHLFLKDGLTVLASVFPASAQSPTAVAAMAGPAEGAEDAEAGMASLQLGENAAASGGHSGAGGAHGPDVHASSESKEESQRSRTTTKDLTDSGSCSSEYEPDRDDHEHDHDAATEMASLRSFDSDSLYSFSAAELHPHPHAAASAMMPGLGYSQQLQQLAGSSSGGHPQLSSRGWRWMLPKASDQQQQQQASSQIRPPPHPQSPLLQPSSTASVIAVPALSALPLPLASHAHRNHRCHSMNPSAASASSSSSDAAAASSVVAASSTSVAAPVAPSRAASSSSEPHLPSIMDELNAFSRSKPPPARSTGACECCDAGCELDFSMSSSSRPASPVIHPQQQHLQQAAPPAYPHSYLLHRSHSTPTSVSSSPDSAAATAGSPSPLPGLSSSPPATAAAASASSMPPAHPQLLLASSYSSSSLDALRAGLGPNPDESSRRLLSALADAEKRARRAESTLKAQLRSDQELRAQLAALTQDSSRFETLHSQYRSAQLNLDLREKDAAKLVWERDRLRIKNKTLMERNNELKADSESLAALRKEHTQLVASYARLSGQNVNASTSPAVLQELLLHHAAAIERVHKQMATNLAAERAALKESRSCKVCMSKPCDTILLPCSHFVLCGACAASITKCPICRDRPQDKRPVYM